MKWLSTVSVLCVSLLAFAPDRATETQRFGGRYDRLLRDQQKLVDAWILEYSRITGQSLETESIYDSLPLSTRTTFEAVTHALLRTKLTAEDGSSLGNGLDLVQLIEAVHGQIPNTRGDHQFRVYVLLKPDALDLLYKSREFKRTRDNTIYHVSYPICFRQQGGVPSIQVSVTRTGRRADIDVDYRSSGGPLALVNGHLTASNSDVRAGNNYDRHNQRWQGLQDWWQNFLGLFSPQATETKQIAMNVEVPAKPRITDEQPVQEAVYDFYKTWFVDAKPEIALSYLSVRSYACLAEFRSGETLDSGLAALRILQHMRDGLVEYGQPASLEEVMQGIAIYGPESRPVRQDYGRLFGLEHVTDKAAQSADCRVRMRLKLAEQMPTPANIFGDYYISTTRLRKEQGPVTVLTQLWTREEGHWKVISWHLEHPFLAPAVSVVADEHAAPAEVRAAATAPNPNLAKVTETFFDTWLVKRRYEEATAYFAPRTAFCPDIKDAGSVKNFLTQIADELPQRAKLNDLIASVDFSHNHLQKVDHPEGQAFLLTRVSTQLADISECNVGVVSRDATSGDPNFDGKTYQTAFVLKDTDDEGSPVSLLWRLERKHWRIVAATIEAR